jgi:hypothetical protein
MNDEHRFDEQLDAALAKYSDVVPTPGLETRMLSMVRASAGPMRWRFYWVPWVAVPLGLFAAFWIFSLGRREPDWSIEINKSRTGTATANNVTPTGIGNKPSAPQTLAKRAMVQQKTVRVAGPVKEQQPTLVRMAVFPAPLAISPEERLVLAYLRRTPKAEVIAQSHIDAPPTEERNELQNDLQMGTPANRKTVDTK